MDRSIIAVKWLCIAGGAWLGFLAYDGDGPAILMACLCTYWAGRVAERAQGVGNE